MVEIWRWPKALLSASLTACMEMPRRPAVSRSTLTNSAQAAVLGLGATSRSTGDALQLLGQLALDQVETSLASAADQRVLVLGRG